MILKVNVCTKDLNMSDTRVGNCVRPLNTRHSEVAEQKFGTPNDGVITTRAES